MTIKDPSIHRPWVRGRYSKPHVRCFAPSGRSDAVIYVVIVADHPNLVKIGRTTRWSNRRKHYQNWNLRPGDGILHERVFRITDEYVDLALVEAAILSACGFKIAHGREWFETDLDTASRYIDQWLCENDFSYI